MHHHHTNIWCFLCFLLFSLSTESEWTDENDNILYGSYDASLTQQLTEDRDLSADLTSLLTEVPLLCVCFSSITHCCCSNMYLYNYISVYTLLM